MGRSSGLVIQGVVLPTLPFVAPSSSSEKAWLAGGIGVWGVRLDLDPALFNLLSKASGLAKGPSVLGP